MKNNFLATTKFGCQKKFLDTIPECPLGDTGLLSTICLIALA